jgi:DNA polymerase-3 subunit gamma/tau
MVLVRLAYAADLPPPGELVRRLRDGAGAAAGEGAPAPQPRPSRKPEPARAETRRSETPDAEPERQAPSAPVADQPVEPPAPLPEPKSFDDVVLLAEAKRDLKLKHALMEQVRLVRFKPGTIEINPLPQAPRELGQELMRKLKAWTGRVWMVAVSDEEGAAPLGVQRREKEAREIEQVREHPAVKEVLQHFPGARIASVRRVEPAPPADAEPTEEFKEDGTN